MILPSFIKMRHLEDIKKKILSGDHVLDYEMVRWIDLDAFDELYDFAMKLYEKEGIKLKEINISREFKKHVREMKRHDRHYIYAEKEFTENNTDS